MNSRVPGPERPRAAGRPARYKLRSNPRVPVRSYRVHSRSYTTVGLGGARQYPSAFSREAVQLYNTPQLYTTEPEKVGPPHPITTGLVPLRQPPAPAARGRSGPRAHTQSVSSKISYRVSDKILRVLSRSKRKPFLRSSFEQLEEEGRSHLAVWQVEHWAQVDGTVLYACLDGAAKGCGSLVCN